MPYSGGVDYILALLGKYDLHGGGDAPFRYYNYSNLFVLISDSCCQ